MVRVRTCTWFPFQNVDILPAAWVPDLQFVSIEREYVPVDVPELQLKNELKAFVGCNFVKYFVSKWKLIFTVI